MIIANLTNKNYIFITCFEIICYCEFVSAIITWKIPKNFPSSSTFGMNLCLDEIDSISCLLELSVMNSGEEFIILVIDKLKTPQMHLYFLRSHPE